MAFTKILNRFRNGFIFTLCLLPIPSFSGVWDSLFGGNPIEEDTRSIFEAIEKGRVGNVERLLAQGALLEERDTKGCTPLLYAIERLIGWHAHKENIEKIVSILIEQGASLESTDPQGNTPLLKCCANFDYSYLAVLAKTLLERGADLEARNQQGNTPLCVAAMHGKAAILNVLIEKNADKEARNNEHQTALMIAAEKNQVKVVEELLLAGAFIDSRDRNGMTPLMYASYKGNLAIIQMLLKKGADIGLKLTSDVQIVSKNENSLSYYPNLYANRIIIPKGATALTFAEKCGGRGAEKILLEAWVKIDPAMERVYIEWKKKVAEC